MAFCPRAMTSRQGRDSVGFSAWLPVSRYAVRYRAVHRAPTYSSYVGVTEMMPLAKGVSVKPTVWDFKGNQSPLDYPRMMKIVVDAGYHGYCGIEHGVPGREVESISEVRQQLEAARDQLSKG